MPINPALPEVINEGDPAHISHHQAIHDYLNPGGGLETELASKQAISELDLIGLTHYWPAAFTQVATTSTSLADVDATNLAVTFTAPASGTVLIRLTAVGHQDSTTNFLHWGLRVGAADVANTLQRVVLGNASSNAQNRRTYSVRISGLTAGTSYTYKWAHSVDASTGRIDYGNANGPAVMEVWKVRA